MLSSSSSWQTIPAICSNTGTHEASGHACIAMPGLQAMLPEALLDAHFCHDCTRDQTKLTCFCKQHCITNSFITKLKEGTTCFLCYYTPCSVPLWVIFLNMCLQPRSIWQAELGRDDTSATARASSSLQSSKSTKPSSIRLSKVCQQLRTTSKLAVSRQTYMVHHAHRLA